MSKKHTNLKKENETKLFAFLAVLLSVLGFLIAFVAKKDDKYVMFYAKQSLILFVSGVIIAIITAILKFIIIVGPIISTIAWAFYFILWLIALVNSLSEKMKDTPLIGHLAEKINL